MKLKLNTNLLSHKKGDTIEVQDENGIPVDQYWRKRLKDSVKDNCVSIIDKKSKVSIDKEEKEEVSGEKKKKKG